MGIYMALVMIFAVAFISVLLFVSFVVAVVKMIVEHIRSRHSSPDDPARASTAFPGGTVPVVSTMPATPYAPTVSAAPSCSVDAKQSDEESLDEDTLLLGGTWLASAYLLNQGEQESPSE
jgi:hypothetical protein